MLENKKKKKILIAAGIVLTVLLVLIIIVGVLDRMYGFLSSPGKTYSYDPFSNPYGTLFYDADYHENIFDDQEYLQKNRYLKFDTGSYAMTYTETELQSAAQNVRFFADYFNAIMYGDAEKYNGFFTDAYYQNNGKPIEPYQKFTMQKVYNISVKLLSEASIPDPDGTIIRGMYEVSYMIMENNATFRPDIFGDTAIPLIFETVTQNGEMKINSIVLPREKN